MSDQAADQTLTSRRSYYLGIGMLFGAATLWSFGGALVKLVHDGGDGPHPVTIVFYRSLFGGLFFVPLAWGKLNTLTRASATATGHRTTPPSRLSRVTPCPAALWCVLFFTLMTICYVLANTKTEAANVIILQYTSTLWIFGLSPLVLKERPGREETRILALAMLGIAIIFAGNASRDLVGLIIALGAGLFYGLLTLMIRRLRNCDPAAVTVLNSLGSALLLLPAVLLFDQLMITPRALVLLVIMGVMQFGLPYYLYALGLARVPAHQAGLITLMEPVLVPLWAYAMISEQVPLATAIGGGVILGSLGLFVRSARRT